MPPESGGITLPEEVLLLALDDRKGTIPWTASTYRQAVGGAVLEALVLARRVRVGEGRRGRVEVVDPGPLGDPLLDECLARVVAAGRPRRARVWVGRFARIRSLKHRLARALCAKGILRDADEALLLIFRRKVYPTTDPGPRYRLLERMRETVFGESGAAAPRDAAIVALAHAADLLRLRFARRELRPQKDRLDRMVGLDPVASVTRAAVREARAGRAAHSS